MRQLQWFTVCFLTALAVALPARIGLVIIGGEGALVLGGFAGAVVAIPLVLGKAPPMLTLLIMAVTAMMIGAIWIGIVVSFRKSLSGTEGKLRRFSPCESFARRNKKMPSSSPARFRRAGR